MISANRDILVERLEQKLAEKEREIEEMRNSLKESIISELREGMKDDLDFDKRLSELEKKIKDMGLAYDGVMKELLDQKTIIKDLKAQHLKKDIEPPTPPDMESGAAKTGSNWPDSASAQNEGPVKKVEPTSNYIIAESEEPQVPPQKKRKDDIIIAERAALKSAKNGEVIVEDRDDEDVVIEYKK